jgi:hypothetical protein
MTEAAGEVADGVICHGFTSASYLSEVTMPALRKGMAVTGRVEDIEVCLPVFLATGPAGADLSGEIARVRKQLAFYASTPAYRGVLDHHGWGDAHAEFHRLSREQRWDDMTGLADDLSKVLLDRFGGLVTGLRLNVPYAQDPQTWAPVIAALKEPAS